MSDCPAVAPEPDADENEASGHVHPTPLDHPPRRSPDRRRLTFLMVPIVAMIIASNVGDALTTTLATSHPLALVALNSRNRILVLVSGELDALSYYTVATLRSEEHTSELQSLMRISYAVFCLKKKKITK